MSRPKGQYDVVVAGGGAAGVAAAVGAAAAGARTVLLEREASFGGEAIHAGINSFGGFYTRGEPPELAVAGVGARMREALRNVGQDDSPVHSQANNLMVTFDPELLKLALDELMRKSRSDYFLHCRIIGVKRSFNQINALVCTDDEGDFTVSGNAFVDASGNAILSHMAGEATMIGDANGVRQIATLAMRICGVSPKAEVSRASLAEAIAKARTAGFTDLMKDKGGIQRRGKSDIVVLLIPSFAHSDLSCGALTEAELDTRKQAHAYMAALQRFHPGMENAHLVQTGPCIGIREGRRTIGETVLTGADALSLIKFDDAVARCGWAPEIHKSLDRLDLYEPLPDHAYFGIPIRALKAAALTNLWCGGRAISADPVAYAAVRVMGCGFATGHAAGVAAALSGGNPLYDTKAIQQELQNQGALI